MTPVTTANHALARGSGRNRLYIVVTWAALMALTILSWWFGDGASLNAKAAAVVVLAIAFAKVLAVGQVFMEQRYSAWALRLAYAGWCVAVFAILMAFLFG
jgi:hypothetical protein